MQIKPILAALRHHRLATVLIALEIALACAVLCNACFLIVHRVQAMRVPSGVDESSLALLRITGFEQGHETDLNARMLDGLRALPGVQSASVINIVPFDDMGGMGMAGVTLAPDSHKGVGVLAFYKGDQQTLHTLGLRLLAGRWPTPDDYQALNAFMPKDANVLVTPALAEHLWPGHSPLGQVFWDGSNRLQVIGVMDRLLTPQPGNYDGVDWSVFVPARSSAGLVGSYLIRARPQNLPVVLRQARDSVRQWAPDAVLDGEASQMLLDKRAAYFQGDRVMSRMLAGVAVALLLVTALGIVGLASFWVGRRRKQIGTRRAIGATRGDILRYFQLENFLIVSLGVLLGGVLTYGLNLLLMAHYEVPRLPVLYFLIGALTQWVLGQLAVLGPALRAAAVPPVVATRSV